MSRDSSFTPQSPPIPATVEDFASQPPVLVVATEGEWASRSLESVLVGHGYVVVRAMDGADALTCARRTQPDALILDQHLPGIGGIEVCGQLRDDPTFDPATPIIITGSAPASRATKTAAIAAGAWEFCTQPLDTDSLLMQLTTFIRAKRASAVARAKSMVDESTGVLTPLGMEKWAEQLAARASRNHEPLACVVLMPASQPHEETSIERQTRDINAKVAQFLQMSREHFRRSDIVGRTTDGRVAVLAPATDNMGVHGLLARLRNAIASATDAPGKDFRAGYWAVQDFASAPLEPAELLRRAAKALDHVNLAASPDLAIGFDQIPIS